MVILLSWLAPAIASILPSSWWKMQATTALTVMLITINLAIKRKTNSKYVTYIRHTCVVGALIIMCFTLIEHLYGHVAILGKHFIPPANSALVYPTSIQSVVCLIPAILFLTIDERRQDKLGYVSDVLIFLLSLFTLTFISGHLFNASHVVGSTSNILISVQTLICITLITIVQISLRASYGAYSILVSRGIGGRFARKLLPISIILSYLIVIFSEKLSSIDGLSHETTAAGTSTVLAILLIIVIIVSANKVNALAMELEYMAMHDQLTSIYNLRGLHLLAEQSILNARRNDTPLTLFLFDIDGLKKVNDNFGHDMGSELIREFTALLRNCFRSNDILARTGGDEFVVITETSETDAIHALNRLSDAAFKRNESTQLPYRIAFSTGMIGLNPSGTESIDDLLAQADKRMYRNKKQKKVNGTHITSV